MALDLMPSDEPGTRDDADTLRALVSGYSIEIMPSAAAGVGAFQQLLPAATQVFIPYPPGSAAADQERLAARLLAEGMVPVPHLVARSLTGRDELAQRLERLAAAGVRDLLLIAGDVPTPQGRFTGTVDILETGLLEKWGFDRLRFAGHPEGLPTSTPEAVSRALAAKLAYARSRRITIGLITQFTFASAPIIAWLEAMSDAAPDADIRIGVPGPSSVRALLSFALQCGIGNSVKVLRRRPWEVARLARHWAPDEILRDLAGHVAQANPARPPGIHVFPFGGFQRSVHWLAAVRHGRFEFEAARAGFSVIPESTENSVDRGSDFGRL